MAGSTPSHSVVHNERRDESRMGGSLAYHVAWKSMTFDHLIIINQKWGYGGWTHGKLVLGFGQDSVQLGEGV